VIYESAVFRVRLGCRSSFLLLRSGVGCNGSSGRSLEVVKSIAFGGGGTVVSVLGVCDLFAANTVAVPLLWCLVPGLQSELPGSR